MKKYVSWATSPIGPFLVFLFSSVFVVVFYLYDNVFGYIAAIIFCILFLALTLLNSITLDLS